MGNYGAPSDVLLFWFGEGSEYGKRHKRWFEKDAAFDAEIRVRFLPLCDELLGGARRDWLERPADCLARIVALDQFPRNMFRGSARAFEGDALALEAARHALARAYDRDMLPVERMFACLPFEHSESLEDQLLACELTLPLAAFAESGDAHWIAVPPAGIIRCFRPRAHEHARGDCVSEPARLRLLNP
jgi:uncharacterized protein (DUF924 family)